MYNKEPDFRSEDEISASDHADYIVKRLEKFIRDGRTPTEGMSFRKWQNLAKIEITKSILDTKNKNAKDDKLYDLLIFVTAAAMVTVGFWGVAVSLNKVNLLTAAVICLLAGFGVLLLFFWFRYRTFRASKEKLKRAKMLKRIDTLNKRIKKLERELDAEETEKQRKIEEIRRPLGGSIFDSLN